MILSVATNFFFQNKMLNAAFIGWVSAQLIKVIISLICGRFEKTRIAGTGGMPSSHTATVIALTTAAFITCGYQSAEFAISLALAGIVMYDAMGIRRAAGKQAATLNYLKEKYTDELPEEHQKQMNVLLGHKPIEVLAGIALGILIGCLVVLI